MNEWRTDKPKENGEYLVTICFTAGGQMGDRLAILAYGTPEDPNEEVDGKCWYLPSEENDGVYDIVYADTEIFAWQELPKVYEADDQESEYIDREQFRKALIHYTQTFKDKYTIYEPSKLFDYLRGLANLLNRYPTADVVDRARYKQLLENSTIMADALKEYENEDVVEVVRCKDCKHFEYDHPYIIQGIPILGHEVCNAWGNGCKTVENGYCFMAERREDEQIY